MSNFQKINKRKTIYCPFCDNPMNYKDTKCSNCGHVISSSKNKQIKKFYRCSNEFKSLRGI